MAEKFCAEELDRQGLFGDFAQEELIETAAGSGY
jgi:hypothetical protein